MLLGVNEKELAPVSLDPDAEPHLLLFGDGRSGKSAVPAHLRARGDAHPHAEQAQLVVVDYRRSLLGRGARGLPAQLPHLGDPGPPAIKDLATYLESRIPGPDVTPEQLRNRRWWTGAEVFVARRRLRPRRHPADLAVALLQPLLAQARDVGLHVVVARRSGGASRALYEPVIQSLRDLAMPG